MADPTPAGTSPQDNRGVMIVLAYLPPLSLIPLLLETADSDLQWHARHGLVLMVVEFMLMLGLFAVITVLGLLTAGLFCAAYALLPVLFLAYLALHVVAVIKALSGDRLIVPGVSQYVDRF